MNESEILNSTQGDINKKLFQMIVESNKRIKSCEDEIKLLKEIIGEEVKTIIFQVNDENGNPITSYHGLDLEILDYEKDAAALCVSPINSIGQAIIPDLPFGHYKIAIPYNHPYDTFIKELIVNKDTPNHMNLTIPWTKD